ncbi:MAG: SGNH/GDSL hydrolase family protein [Spirochaetota bacterium]
MDINKKIMIITDSVSMPRDKIPYENTWIFRLKEAMPGFDFMDRSARGSTSTRLVTEGGAGADLLESYMPGLVILQLGITECAPRLFNKKGFEIFFLNHIIPKKYIPAYINYVKRTRERNPNITNVSPEQYRLNLINFAERCKNINTALLIVAILRPSSLYISKSPKIKNNIDLYNNIAKETANNFSNIKIIDPAAEVDNVDSICLDELHINIEGHDIYFKKIFEALRLIYNR